MSKLTHTHALMLAMQLSSVFKYVSDAGWHRDVFKNFKPLENHVIEYSTTENYGRKGRSSVDILVKTERNTFLIRQWYNFGILLELELQYLKNGCLRSLMSTILDQPDGSQHLSELMIDFEYVISIVTENVALQLNRQE